MRALQSWNELVAAPLASDARAWQDHGFAAGLAGWKRTLRLLTFGGYRATVMHRVAFWAHRNHVVGVPTLLHELNQALHGIEITPSIPVGPGLYIPHTVGSVITATSIGANVELQGGITLGLRKADGFPTLHDGVVVSCGARVLGPIKVGSGSVIGANAVVIRDVEPHSVMVGVPATPMSRREPGAPASGSVEQPTLNGR